MPEAEGARPPSSAAQAPPEAEISERDAAPQGEREAISERVQQCSARFQRAVEDAFERVGAVASRWPLLTFFACIIACFLCALGSASAVMDGDPYAMFTVHRGQWEPGNAYTLEHQGGGHGAQPTFEYVMMVPREGEAVDRRVLADQLTLMRAISNISVTDARGARRTLSDVCQSVDIAEAVPDVASLLAVNLTGRGGLLAELTKGMHDPAALRDEIRALAADGTLGMLADRALLASPINVSSVDELNSLIVAANLSSLADPNVTQRDAIAANERLGALLNRLGVPRTRDVDELPNGYDPETGSYVVRVNDSDIVDTLGVNGTELAELLQGLHAEPVDPDAPNSPPVVRLPRVSASQARRMRDAAVGRAIRGDPYAQAATIGALAALYDAADHAAASQAAAAGVRRPAPSARPPGLPEHFERSMAEPFLSRNGTVNPQFTEHVLRRLHLLPPPELDPAPRADDLTRRRPWPGTSTPDWHLKGASVPPPANLTALAAQKEAWVRAHPNGTLGTTTSAWPATADSAVAGGGSNSPAADSMREWIEGIARALSTPSDAPGADDRTGLADNAAAEAPQSTVGDDLRRDDHGSGGDALTRGHARPAHQTTRPSRSAPASVVASDVISHVAWEAWLDILDAYNLTAPGVRAKHSRHVAAERRRYGFVDEGGDTPNARATPPPSEFNTLLDLAFAKTLASLEQMRETLDLPRVRALDDLIARVPMPASANGTTAHRATANASAALPALAPTEVAERVGGLTQLLALVWLAHEADTLQLGDTDVAGALQPAGVRRLIKPDALPSRGGDAALTAGSLLRAALIAQGRYRTRGAGSGKDDAALRAVRQAAEKNAQSLAAQAQAQMQDALRAPCIRTTVLDCFAEGGYDFPLSGDAWRMLRIAPPVRATLEKAGVDAYTRRPSFADPEVDLGRVLAGGCDGFAAAIPALHWHEEAMLGGLMHNETSGAVTHAAALRSTILLAGDAVIADRLHLELSEAAQLTGAFRLAMEHLVPQVPLSTSSASVFVSDAFLRVVDEHMGSASQAVGAGYLLMVVYVLLVLRTPRLALAGLALLLCDLAGGFGLACAVGVPSSILTLTVLPFVALGIAVDGLFLILHTYQHDMAVARAAGGHPTPEEVVPRVTRAVGPSILFTGCTNGAAYAAASTIPLHAIMNFSRQCGILLFFNAAVTLVGVPALIAMLDRRKPPPPKLVSSTDEPHHDGGSSAGRNGHSADVEAAPVESNVGGRCCPPRWLGRRGPDGIGLVDDAHPRSDSLAPEGAPATAADGAHDGSAATQCASLRREGIVITIARTLARAISAPAGHWGVISVFGVATAVALVGVCTMEPGLILSELVPETDITSAYLKAEGDYFSFFPVTVATKALAYEEPSSQRAILDLHAELAVVPEAVRPLPPFWLQALLDFANSTGTLDESGLLPREAFYDSFVAWREADALAFAQAQGNFGYDSDGSIVYAEIPLYVHGVQQPGACIAFVGRLASICDEASGRGIPSYALGLPFYRCERYVHLRFWCVRGITVALLVVLGVSVLFMGALREACIMTLTLLLNLCQLAGCLAFAGMKINGALVMAVVASIGCASEYAGHFSIAFLQAHGTAAERLDFAYTRSLHPLFDSACSTVLGIAMIAFAAFPFVVKYFFYPMVLLTILNFVNAIVLLPSLLFVLGKPQPHAVDTAPKSPSGWVEPEASSPSTADDAPHALAAKSPLSRSSDPTPDSTASVEQTPPRWPKDDAWETALARASPSPGRRDRTVIFTLHVDENDYGVML